MRKDEFPIIDKHVKNEINAVLDKIRAEIESIYKEDLECDGCSDMGMVLDIIDRYKGEQT